MFLGLILESQQLNWQKERFLQFSNHVQCSDHSIRIWRADWWIVCTNTSAVGNDSLVIHFNQIGIVSRSNSKFFTDMMSLLIWWNTDLLSPWFALIWHLLAQYFISNRPFWAMTVVVHAFCSWHCNRTQSADGIFTSGFLFTLYPVIIGYW